MIKHNQLMLKKALFGITALVLGFGPFVTANGADGIATGSINGSNLSSASPGQQAAFAAMGSLCSNFGGDLGITTGIGFGLPGFGPGSRSLACSLTSSSSSSANNSLALQQLSPQSAIQAETISITSPYKFIRSVNQQAQELIECNDPKTKKLNPECDKGSGASADTYSFIGPFGISLNGGGGIGDRDDADGQTGFQLDTRQANLMIDYSFNQKLIGGFSFGYLRAERSFGLASGNLDSDSYRFAPFLVFRPTSNSYLTMMGGYALVNYNSTRSVSPFNGITISNAFAEYDADQFFASVGGGYTFSFLDGWSLRGYARGDYSHTVIESFQEAGGRASDGNSYAMKINGQSIHSVTSTVGVELSYAISTTILPAVIIPKLHAEWVHEYEDSGRTNEANFNQNGSSASTGAIAVAGPERNWANLGFGVQMLFPHAIVGYVNYDALLIENGSNHTITGGVRISF